MKTLLRSISIVALSLLAAGCRSKDAALAAQLNQTVYNRVGMHFDIKGSTYLMYSTNYIGMPHYVPPGTELTLVGMGPRELRLTDAAGSDYRIRYVPKHSLMPITQWKDTWFSTQPVSLPSDLTDEERDAIAAGDVRIGMSRDAVFLALGYPPNSTNPSQDGSVITYDMRRMVRRSIRFGPDDKVTAIGL